MLELTEASYSVASACGALGARGLGAAPATFGWLGLRGVPPLASKAVKGRRGMSIDFQGLG